MNTQSYGLAICYGLSWRRAAALLCMLAGLHCGGATPPLAPIAAPPVQLSLSPSNAQIAQGTAQQFSVRGLDASGHHRDLTQTAHFSVSAPDGSQLSIQEDGLLPLEKPGRYQVTADYQGRSVTTFLTVTTATLTSLFLSPTAPKVAQGRSQAFTATARFSDGTTQSVTGLATWSAKDVVGSGIVLINTRGIATARNVGQASITARYKTVSASTILQVTAAVLTSLAITPSNPTLAVAGSLTFSAQGTYSDGTVQDVTASADWGVTDLVGTEVASIDGSMVVADSAGQATVSAFYQGLEVDTTLTVAAVTLSTLAISPLNPSATKGAKQQFTATGSYSDGTTYDLTAMVSWTATDIAPAMGVAMITASGLATANQAGQATITASYLGFSSSTPLTVTPGGLWVPQASGTTAILIDVWGTDANNVWVVGDSGTILKWNGSTWASRASGTTQRLQGVWGTDANNVWAVGYGGTILKWNGASWSSQASGTTTWLGSVWGLDPNNVWVVGESGTILKWNGTSWALQASGTSTTLLRVWGLDANNIWAVGNSGTILKWNGTSWASQTSGITTGMSGLWGSDSSNIWAAGESGLVRWNGTSWAAQASGTTARLDRLWGSDARNVWAVGAAGTIVKWDGTSWAGQASGTVNQLAGVWGAGANNVWIAGVGGTILRWMP